MNINYQNHNCATDETILHVSSIIGDTGVSCNSFYSNFCSVVSVEYLKLFFISLDSPLVTLERDIFRLTKGCLMSDEIELK